MPKKELRKKVLALRDCLDTADIERKSALIKDLLFSLKEFREAATILFFLSFGKEVRTEAMVRETLKQDKEVLVPKTDTRNHCLILSRLWDYDGDLAPGIWGIPEPKTDALRPVDPREVDLVVVPGVAFDGEGNRMGYGGGYYDRLFPLLREGTPLVALAFQCQLVEEVPTEPYDRKIHWLITEEAVFSFPTRHT